MDMSTRRVDQAALIEAIGAGLPLTSRPYAALAEKLGCSETDVIDAIERLLAGGDVKRFGVVVRHRALGYQANGMVVWDVPDERVADVGRCIGGYGFVTLCYRRPRRPPDWPYNLFCMIHGRDRDAVVAQVGLIVEQCGLGDIAHEILFSRRCFRQRGARYAPATARAADDASGRAAHG